MSIGFGQINRSCDIIFCSLTISGTEVRQIFIELAGFLFLSLKVLSVTIFISVLPYRNFAVRRKEIDMTIDIHIEDLVNPNLDITDFSDKIASRMKNELNIADGYIRVNQEDLITLLNIGIEESYNKGFSDALRAITNHLEKENVHLRIQQP